VIKVQHIYCLMVLFLFLFVKGFSQNDTVLSEEKPIYSQGPPKSYYSNSLQVTFHQGAILPHRAQVMEVIEKSTQAIEISYNKTTFGKKTWQQLYSYPKVGISALVIGLGNPEKLGNGYGIFPFIELPLNHGKVSLKFKNGYGLGYIQKPFDRELNPKNIAIGSHINALIYANMMMGVNITKQLNANLGLSLIHFSNGSSSRPNLGINILSANFGAAYRFGVKEPRLISKLDKRDRIWRKQMMVGIGLKEIPPAGGPKYLVTSYSFNMMKVNAEKSAFGFGADIFYNTSLSDLMARDSSATSNSFDNVRLGVLAMYSIEFAKISASIGLGAYVFSNYKGNGSVYNKLDLRYAVNEKIFLRLGMKTHIAVADFVEIGVGYNF